MQRSEEGSIYQGFLLGYNLQGYSKWCGLKLPLLEVQPNISQFLNQIPSGAAALDT